ncbi:DNA polymerase Y family protein [Flavobacterium sp. MAH-1]|uniref:DNA polymerase Y family protein n=1 Tax=Flavobacterium agri TaxID=2743471 RepID=A0A7Y8Y433_9FLAO|nr:DNA polymerase Y family protein [Flavobacterium agri]NUY81926.1 DNA polymerase Y family protein [Flavobacterium agri]NYA71950.1 DNA polymerase Y family protein [Flavobacterium agri]
MPRYASIWFPYLLAESVTRKRPELRDGPVVLASRQRGRMVIDAVNAPAKAKGIHVGMVVADCKAIFPDLRVLESESGKGEKIIQALAEWSIRYTPFSSVDLPDGLILDTTGCTHLWGGEKEYLESIEAKLGGYGYTVRCAMADTIGAAWAATRFANPRCIVKPGKQKEILLDLSPEALRLEASVLERLRKLGLKRIGDFIDMPPSVLRRRFGAALPLRIGQALGQEMEFVIPVEPIEPYRERLCSMEPIATAAGITIALRNLLEILCQQLATDGMGLRQGIFRAYRIDGDVQHLEIGTNLPSRNPNHLFKLFEHKIATLRPDLGFELFVLEATDVEPVTDEQAAIWNAASQNDAKIGELLDKVMAKAGRESVSRYLPAEQYWPERAVKKAMPLWEKPVTPWRTDWPRPIHLLSRPETIEVTAVLPDYPPMLFRYKGKTHHVAKSDGPERIEQEWWLADGLYRDYYCVEDESGARYWLFRSGPYDAGRPEWFIHGFFA